LRRIGSLSQPPGCLIDVGSGPGIFVSEAERAGWQAYGLEPASWAVRHGRQAYKVEIVRGDLLKPLALPVRQFDVVTMFDVIEHVADPAALLRSAAALLRTGGILVLTTPRFDSLLARILGRHWYCIFPAHLQYFTEKSLRHSTAKAGFKFVAQLAHTRYVSFGYGWRRLCAWLTGGTIPNPSGSDSKFIGPINFGDEFELYASKR